MRAAPAGQSVVFVTVGSLGDIFPYLSVARELRRRGFRCTIATGRMHRKIIEDNGLAFHEVRPDLTNHEEAPEWLRMAIHSRRGSEYIIRRMILPFLHESYEDLDAVVNRADCVVAHPLAYAAKLAAERHGVPLVVAALQPSIFFSSYDPPVVARTPTRGVVRGLGHPFYALVFQIVRMVMRAWAQPIRRFRSELGLSERRVDALIEGQYSPDLNLALFSPLIAQPDRDWPAHTVQTGFAFYDRDVPEPGDGSAVSAGDSARPGAGADRLPPATGGLPADLERFLEAGPPPVVFTLGSLAVMNPGSFFAESASAARRLRVRAVLLTGGDGAMQLGGSGDLFTAGYVPHSRLFPRAAAVVHQGGIGTTAEALRAGKPALVVPFSNDQPDNAYRAARLGVARVLPPKRYEASRASYELGALLGEGAYAERAATVAEEIARERGAERASDVLEAWLGRPKN